MVIVKEKKKLNSARVYNERFLSHPQIPESPFPRGQPLLASPFRNILGKKECRYVIHCLVILSRPLTPLRIEWQIWIFINYTDEKMWHTISFGIWGVHTPHACPQ